jgi:peptidoglycan/LPS O-acetylase OafA/YrhL
LFTHLVTVPLTLDGQWSFGLFDSFWSLAIEEQFYLLWPLAVVRFGRTGLIRLCIALWAISFATRVGMCWAGASWISVYVFTPGRLDGLVCGAILALLARGPEGLTAYRTPIRWMGLAALATLVGIGVATGGLSNEHTLVLTVGILALAVLSGAVVASAAQGGSLLSSLASVPFLQFLGTYSYGLYIFNLPVSKLVMNSDHLSSMLPDGYLSRTLLLIVINFAICLAIAVPCYHLFEMQFLKLKRKFQ